MEPCGCGRCGGRSCPYRPPPRNTQGAGASPGGLVSFAARESLLLDPHAPLVDEPIEVGRHEARLGLLEVGNVEAEPAHPAAQQLLLFLGGAPEMLDENVQGSPFGLRETVAMLRHLLLR